MWFLLLRQTLIRGGIDKMKGISEKTLIKIKDLKASVKLNNGDMLTTVTNANMELQRGRSYAIVGKSGSGKTSLISIIGLLNREYEGEYLYDGISISALKDRDLSILRANNIGFVFQNYSLIKHLRVWENIELPLLYAKKSFTAKQRHEIITGLSEGGSLEVVINKEAKNYFNDSPYAAGNVKSTLSLTPFNIVGVVNDGRDFPTIYADSAAILNFAPAMWQVQNANVYWHPTTGLTIEQIHSALGDILTDTIGGYWESAGRSDIGDTYDSVLSILQLGLLVTSLLLLFVSVLGQINIGLSSLEQRTHELLIRRAIGASRTNIVALVLGSQLILSIFVCFAAILISLILVHCIGALLPVDSPVGTPSYPISVAVVAVAVSVLTALLGGLLPALKAAKLEPALALR